MEYLSDEGYRFDGRKPNEFRMIKGRLGVFDRADGSVKGIDYDSKNTFEEFTLVGQITFQILVRKSFGPLHLLRKL